MAATGRAVRFGLGIVLLSFFLPSTSAIGADDPIDRDRAPQTYQIQVIADAAVDVDGRLDEPVWGQALSVRLAYEWFPGDGVAPPVATEALLFYDEERLYVGFRCQDGAPESIRAHLMDRDQIGRLSQDDHVRVLLDTFNDQRRAYEFLINPLGVQADGIFNQIDDETDYSWNIIWSSAGSIGPEGWQVEIAIPLDQLRFPRTPGTQTWGIDLGRSYPRNVRHRITASYRDRDEACLLCQVPGLDGFESLEPGLNLQVVPTVTASRTDVAEAPGASLSSGDEETEGGLTVRWGMTPSTTLAATINPDFSQVEADVARLDVNERFALFFPERRPFFLEGADYFTTQVNAVFTRQIADPRWGLRLTGKEGDNAFGLLVASDRVNNLSIPSNENTDFASLDDDVESAIARWRRDIGSSSTVGVLYTGREGESGYRNHVGAVDAFVRLGPKQDVSAQILFSETEYPTEIAATFGQPLDRFGGHAAEIFYNYRSRDWIGLAGYRNYGDGFRADSGFVPRVDLETYRGELIRQFWGDEGDPWVNLQIGGTAITTDDQSGELSDRRFTLFSTASGPRQSYVRLASSLRDQRSGTQLFENLLRGEVYAEIRPTGGIELTFDTLFGETVDVANDREASSIAWTGSVEVQPGDHANARLSLTQEVLDVDAGQLFDARIAELRLTYQFNVRTFVRGIFQYLDVDRAQDLYLGSAPPDVEQLLSQLLFSYKLNPQTVLFLGYSDTRFAVDEDPIEESDRTFFLKIGYAWTH